MKILVLGAGGMAGHTAALYLSERGYDVTGFGRTGSPVCKTILGDARDQDALRKALKSEHWTHIVNCAGLLNADCDADPISAVEVNTLLPLRLYAHCSQSGARLVHISTDYVFRGRTAPYTIADPPDGITGYARTKALGEVTGPNAVTLRTSIVGPDLNPGGRGLFNWFMQAQSPVNGFANAAWTGITSLTLAKVIEQCILRGAEGLCQPVPDTSISKYSLLCLFSRLFTDGEKTVLKDPSPRVTPVLEQTIPFPCAIPDYETMLLELREWTNRHSALYPHYRLTEKP